MLITVSSSIAFVLSTIMLGVALYLTLKAVKKYHHVKSVYGDLAVSPLPTPKQVKRLRELKQLEYTCIILVVSVFVLIGVVAVQF